MIDLRLRNRVSKAELEPKVGKILGDQDYNLLLTGPARVRMPDNRPLAVYLPGVLAGELDKPGIYEILHGLSAQVTDNRALASGSVLMRSGRQLRARKVSSTIIGSIDPKPPRSRACRLTAWTGQNLPQWQQLIPLLQAVALEQLHYVPDRAEAQHQAAAAAHPAWVVPGTPFSTITVNNCVDPATECLSRDRGWITYDKLSPGDEILAYDPVTHTTRWERTIDVFVNENYAGPMTELSSRGFSALTTPDHRWPLQPPVTLRGSSLNRVVKVFHTQGLPSSDYWSVMRNAPHEAPGRPVHSDAFVRLAAWYFTEGTMLRAGTSVSLCQSDRVNPIHVDSIRRDLKSLGAVFLDEWRTRSCSREDCTNRVSARGLCQRHYNSWAHQQRKGAGFTPHARAGRSRRTGLVVNEYPDRDRPEMIRWVLTGDGVTPLLEAVPGRDKVPTAEFLTSLTESQLRMFVETAVAADGSPEHGRFYQYHSGRMNAFVMAVTLAGLACTVDAAGTCCSLRGQRSRGEGGVRISTKNIRRETQDYEGTIWCPRVPSSHWVARRAGTVYLSGNTYPTGVHTDKGDLDAGFSAIACLRRGSYTGGRLVFPEYRVAVDLHHGDLLLMDAHQYHGNTALVCACGTEPNNFCRTCGAERISVVSYFRTKVTECGSPDEELRKATDGR
jgi:hypothetical protein